MVTKFAVPSLATDTLERVDKIDTSATIETGIASTIVDILMTVDASISRIADTLASVALASAAAGHALAAAAEIIIAQSELRIMNDRFGAVPALPLRRTVTVVVGLGVEARRRVFAGVRVAVIPIDLAVVAGVAHRANALVQVLKVATLAPVLAGVRGALVDINLAVFAGITGGAGTVVVVNKVNAQGPVEALTYAVVDVFCAVLAGESASTSTSANHHTNGLWYIYAAKRITQSELFEQLSLVNINHG